MVLCARQGMDNCGKEIRFVCLLGGGGRGRVDKLGHQKRQ